jgi:hypothetical protein
LRKAGIYNGAVMAAPNRKAALVAAVAALILGGFGQEQLLILGYPQLGIALVIPILIMVAWLWRPDCAAISLVLAAFGVELLLPLQTGGGRSQDWLLHYQIALVNGGFHNSANLLGRTPLFHELIGAVLNHNPTFWTYQIVAVLLNSLWLWPATLLIGRFGSQRPPLRLVAVALAPVVIAYTLYTWPWNFSAFFLLAALWLVDEEGLIAGVGVGLALAGALLAHPGSLGYVVGLGAWWLLKRRRAALAGVAAGAVAVASAVPWLIMVTGSAGPAAIIRGSVPALGAVPPAEWLVSRLLLVANTAVPPLNLPGDRLWLSVAVAFLVLTLPGALITVLLAGPPPPVRTVALMTIAGGAAVALAIYPANQDATGMLDALYPGVLIYLIEVAAIVADRHLRRILWLGLLLGPATIVALTWLAFEPVRGDLNLVLQTLYRVAPFEQRWGPAPGLLLLGLGLAIGLRAATRRRKVGGSPTREGA